MGLWREGVEGELQAPAALPRGQVHPLRGQEALGSASENCVRRDPGGPPAAFRPPRRAFSIALGVPGPPPCGGRAPGRWALTAAAGSQEHRLRSMLGKNLHLL